MIKHVFTVWLYPTPIQSNTSPSGVMARTLTNNTKNVKGERGMSLNLSPDFILFLFTGRGAQLKQ
jgi:hypothetical protein